jgi:hypothetical protein
MDRKVLQLTERYCRIPIWVFQVTFLWSEPKPHINNVFFFIKLSFLSIRFFLHLEHKNSVHTPFLSLNLGFMFTMWSLGCESKATFMCNESEAMSDLAESYNSSVLLIIRGHEDSRRKGGGRRRRRLERKMR